jgi:hypothetical protein
MSTYAASFLSGWNNSTTSSTSSTTSHSWTLTHYL